MTTISLLIPTRNRPEKLASVVSGAIRLASRPDDLEFLFYLDQDDLVSAPAIEASAAGCRRTVVRGERLHDQSYWNQLADRASGDILFLGADDLGFRSEGWDERIRTGMAEACAGGIGMVYGDDAHFGSLLATHPFVSRGWVESAGFFVPPYFERCFVDLWIFELAVLTSLFRYLPEVVIEHLHVGLAKAQGDALYEEIIRRPFDHRRYAELAPERREQAERLLAAAGLRREVDVAELERRRADARNPPGGNWFVWP